MKFALRTDWDLSENELTLAIRNARSEGRSLLDLTVSNPTTCGFEYDSAALLEPLSVPGALQYEPNPLGMRFAREAVARYYSDHNANIDPDSICLTTSTSEAYSFLFRLLCDPGDEVLIAQPSYPLFEFLASLDDLKLVKYPLFYDHGWHIDLHALGSLVTQRTRALVVVHPNNPTGNYASRTERAALRAFCAQHGLALIVDEVFLDYAVPTSAEPSFLAEEAEGITFVLSGISKICGLPQMKLSWIVASGPEELVRSAMERIEVIADTFLSVNAPTQFALPKWLGGRDQIQAQIQNRMQENLAALDMRLRGTQLDRLVLQGGWTAVLRTPRHIAGQKFEQVALDSGVIVQPGEFYGLQEGRVVVSLLTPPEIWKRGLALMPM